MHAFSTYAGDPDLLTGGFGDRVSGFNEDFGITNANGTQFAVIYTLRADTELLLV